MTDVKYPAFMDPKEIETIMYTEEAIDAKVKEMAAEISKAYQNIEKPLIVICTLKGAAPFFAVTILFSDFGMQR